MSEKEFKEIINTRECYCCCCKSENIIIIDGRALCRPCAIKHFKYYNKILEKINS